MHIRSQNVIVNVNICDIHRIYESKGLYFIKVNVNNSPNLLNQDDKNDAISIACGAKRTSKNFTSAEVTLSIPIFTSRLLPGG